MAENTSSTIVDIARELDISPSTVSRALQDNPKISDKTKERVKTMAKKLGYRRNSLAAGLRSRRSGTIGLIVPRISMYFQSTMVTAIQNIIHDAGYNLMICQSNDSIEQEMELVKTLFDARVDGLIVSATMHTMDFTHFELFTDHDIPVVFYDRVPSKFPARIIRGDDYKGGYQVGEHLVEKGCQNIAFINGLLSCNLYRDRQKGVSKALAEADIFIGSQNIYNQLLTRENALTACQSIFGEDRPYPDAIFCANDTTAIAVQQFVMRETDLRIPEDLKIIGYSNDPRVEIIRPSITSVEQHPEDMGRLAAQSILELMGSEGQIIQQETLVQTELEKRGSSN